jgi:hypothetical protein
MGVFNKHIQEIKATAELKQLWKRWFGSPIICDTSDIQGQQGLPYHIFTPIITLTCGMILLAVIVAVICRIVWWNEIEESIVGEKIKKSRWWPTSWCAEGGPEGEGEGEGGPESGLSAGRQVYEDVPNHEALRKWYLDNKSFFSNSDPSQ